VAQTSKIIALKCNLDLSANYFDEFTARFIKNLSSYVGANNEIGSNTSGENIAVLKPLQSNEIYAPISLPDGDNIVIGARGFALVNRVYVFVYNSEGNHLIYRINGSDRTCEIVKVDTLFNFQLDPKYFIGEGQCHLEVNTFVNPDNGEEVTIEDLYWTDGLNYQGYLRVQDSIDTNGFDGETFGYFLGDYDKRPLIRMGLPTPKDCISYTEKPQDESDLGIINTLLFKTFQFRVSFIDVWGRQSEHGIISNLYIPGINDCISSSSNLPRCLLIDIVIDNPIIDKVQIEYCNNNSENWSIDSTINLYVGSNLGAWWTRARNTDVVFNTVTNVMSYTFCRNKECDPIAVSETNTLQPGIAKNSQAIGKVGSKIGLANNKYGFNPLPQSLLDNITLKITPPNENENVYRDIVVYVPIYNVFEQGGKFTSIFLNGDNSYVFGLQSNFTDGTGNHRNLFDRFQQRLPTGQAGILGYLSDGSTSVSTQVTVGVNGEVTNDGTFDSTSPIGLKYLKFEFKSKLPAKYIFRLASHLLDLSGSQQGYQRTSTTIWGVCPFINNNNSAPQIDTSTRLNKAQELLIDVCNNNYNTLNQSEILVMADLTGFYGRSGANLTSQETNGIRSAVAGYISESSSSNGDPNGVNPMELAEISVDLSFQGGNRGNKTCVASDHNGFYWTELSYHKQVAQINVSSSCIKRMATYYTDFQGMSGGTIPNPANGSSIVLDSRPEAYFSNYSGLLCNRVKITGRVFLSNEGSIIGLPNISVTLTRGGSVPTDSNGYFTILAHDEITDTGNGIQIREDYLVFNSVCDYRTNDGACLELISITILPCNICQERDLSVNDITLTFLNVRGLLSGGTYGWFINAYDYLGRKTYSQPLGYFTIPSIVQSQSVGFSEIEVTIPPSVTFPDEIEYVTFSITQETTMETYLDWIVDNVDFIDATGAINVNGATQIKIYYGSVIEFNVLNNYNTTVNWQFIQSATNTPFVSDVVQFLLDSNGNPYTKTLIELVKYSQAGQYFTIDYTSDLADLKSNALIRLARPKICTGNEPTYEICDSKIDIINGKAQVNTFKLNAYDTYLINTEIPVPVAQPIIPPATTPTYEIELRIPGFRFERNSPSNFWGQDVSNIGRLNVKNPYEAEIIKPNEISLSGILSPNGQISFLQQFDDTNKFVFDVPNNGGIIYFKNEIGKVGFIAQYDHYVVGYNDNLARINPDGTMQAGSIVDSFGQPQRNNGDTYGCQLIDKLSVASRNGLISFADRSRADVLQYNYSQIVSLTKDETIVVDGVKRGKIDAYFISKVKSMLADTTRFFVGTINPVTGEYLLTDFSLTTNSYINQLRTYNPSINETISFDINTRNVKSFYSFTPEMYAFLDGDTLNVQLFSFKQGVPYNHYDLLNNNSYNNFYGVQCETVIKLIITNPPFIKKNWLSIANYCKQSNFFCDEIITEAGQLSNIMLSEFEQAYYFSFAPFFRDINTPTDINDSSVIKQNPRLEGNPLYGNWISVRLIGDPANFNNYLEYFGSVVDYFKQEKSG
jgi:hypothetical protein